MKTRTFRVGAAVAQYSPVNQAWIVTHGLHLRVAFSEVEAERYARQMATQWGAPLDSSPRIDGAAQ